MTIASTAENGQADTGKIFAYFAPLTLLVYLVMPHGYLLDFATSYMLKDQLHASATQVSLFRLLTAIPVYLSVVFGLTRDLWNPLGMRDRGYFLIFAPITAVVFGWMAYAQLTYTSLFIGMFLVMFFWRFVSAGQWALLALVGQEKLMSGRLSALWNIMASIPYIVGALASGWIAEHLPPRQTFILMVVFSLLMFLFAFWKPKAVFAHAYDKPQAKGSDLIGDIKRLLKHRAVYPAVLIMFMFQFAPGSNTPLQFYLTNKLHASDAVYTDYYAIFAVAFIPMFFLYGWLCKKVSLRALLWIGTIITIPQLMPLAFVNSASQALWLALPIGMMGGIAAGAYYDLAMRSCPPGLQGTLMMMVDGMYMLSYRGGDLLGAQIYASSPTNGFLYCALATTAVYALILPVILLIPKELIATADGEKNPKVEAEMLSEIAETSPA
ncbi:MAG TPA: MFS transporter [Rhizomicrobium sp.]|jgi:MFS family permease|nr:MFS transporter [Rhizomicrobium sp.]